MTDKIIEDIKTERARQHTRWGEQHLTPTQWLAIITEETGEVSTEALRVELIGANDARVFQLKREHGDE